MSAEFVDLEQDADRTRPTLVKGKRRQPTLEQMLKADPAEIPLELPVEVPELLPAEVGADDGPKVCDADCGCGKPLPAGRRRWASKDCEQNAKARKQLRREADALSAGSEDSFPTEPGLIGISPGYYLRANHPGIWQWTGKAEWHRSLSWHPHLEASASIEGEDEGRIKRYQVKVGDVTEWVGEKQLLEGKAWERFPDAAGYGTKPVQGRLCDAVQAQVSSRPRIAYTSKIGWKEIDGKHIYMTGEECIGPDGAQPSTAVQVQGNLTRYRLPVPDLDQARTGVAFLLDNLEIAPRRTTIPLLAATVLPPLGELCGARPDFLMWLQGKSRSGKSELAALALRCYGSTFSKQNMPANFVSTGNQIGGVLHRVGDALLTIDDYCPTESASEQAKMAQTVAGLARSIGNGSARERMNRDTTLRESQPPRAFVLVTAEMEPGIALSGVARMLSVHLKPGDVNITRLGRAQKMAPEVYPAAMASYVQWIAANWDALAETLPGRFNHWQTAALTGQLARGPSQLAYLMTALETFTSWAAAIGVLTEVERTALLWESWDVLTGLEALAEQARAEEDPGRRTLGLLAEAFATGTANVTNRAGGMPTDATHWGWRDDGNVKRPGGKCIGTVDDAYVYLYPEAFYAWLRSAEGAAGRVLSLDKRTLLEHLDRRGALECRDEKDGRRREVLVRLGDGPRRVVKLRRSALEPDGEDGTDGGTDDAGTDDGPTPGAPAPVVPVDGSPCHPGDCDAPETEPTPLPLPEPTPLPLPESPPVVTVPPARLEPEPVVEVPLESRAAEPTPRGRHVAVRIGVLDASGLHMHGSPVIPASAPGNVGDAMDLAIAHGLEQVWLHPNLDLGGLPDELPEGMDRIKGHPHPFVTDSLPTHEVRPGGLHEWLEGWRRPQEGEEKTPSAAVVNARYLLDPRMSGSADGPSLLAILARFADTTGVAYVRSPARTSMALVMQTHPRQHGGRQLGSSKDWPIRIPSNVETNMVWHRPLLSAETSRRYVHGFDANAAFLAACPSLPLGIGEPEHRTGDAAAFDPKLPGYWLVELRTPHAGILPDPFHPQGKGDGPEWHSTPAVALAAGMGQKPEPVEALVWPEHSAYLRGWQERLRDAREELMADPSPEAKAAYSIVKECYATFPGWLARGGHRLEATFYRRDWFHAIVAQSRTNVYRRLEKLSDAPFAFNVDAAYFATDEPDPEVFAKSIGLPLGTRLGQYKRSGSGLLEPVAEVICRTEPRPQTREVLSAIRSSTKGEK